MTDSLPNEYDTVEEAMIESTSEHTPMPTVEPTVEPNTEPTKEHTPMPTPELTTGTTLEPATTELPTAGMKRPRRAAAINAMEKMQEVLQWEHCNESSHMFKRVAQQINDEFERVAKGERSYHKRSSATSTGDGGAAVPDPPSDDELNETKDNDEVEADSVDGSSEEEGSFVVSDGHLSQGESEHDSTGSDGEKSIITDEKSNLTYSDISDEEVTGLVDDTVSVNESMPSTQPMEEYQAEMTMETLVDQEFETPTQPIEEYLAERTMETLVDQEFETQVVETLVDQEPDVLEQGFEVLEQGFEDPGWLIQTEPVLEREQASGDSV